MGRNPRYSACPSVGCEFLEEGCPNCTKVLCGRVVGALHVPQQHGCGGYGSGEKMKELSRLIIVHARVGGHFH